MKIIYYLLEKISLIIFYIILITFLSFLMMDIDRIIYANIVGLCFLLIYLFFDFIRLHSYTKLLEDYIRTGESNNQMILNLPRGYTYEHKLFKLVLEKNSNFYLKEIEKFDALRSEYETFIESWVHEIKIPISAMRLILSENKEIPQIKSVDEEIDRIDYYIEQVLYYSKMESLSKDYFIQEEILEPIIKNIIKRYAKIFIHKKIQLELDSIDYEVLTDKKWLAFILSQVISNALKYTEDKGLIRIYGTKYEDETIRLTIEDNGIGIKNEDIKRIFDKGFTGHNGRLYQKSTGIGLYLVKNLIDQLGHDVVIESVEKKGTLVHIFFFRGGFISEVR